MKTQLVGVCLAILGFLGTILICALPMWKVSAFIQSNIITAQVFWEGLWMNCVFQSTGQSQCKNYDSVLALPQELQASRALICVSIAVSVVAIGLTVVGARCTSFFDYDQLTKSNAGIAGGVVFIIAGIVCIIPVTWSAYSIITGFIILWPQQEVKESWELLYIWDGYLEHSLSLEELLCAPPTDAVEDERTCCRTSNTCCS